MRRILGILVLVLTLATLLVVPALESYAAVSAVTAPVMQMADGKPCPEQGCAKMPDCPMMMPCLPGFSALMTEAGDWRFQPALQAVRFAIAVHPVLPSLEGDGIRRPPKA